MSEEIVVLFVEGPTEAEFYKAIRVHAHNVLSKPFPCSVKTFDMSGIGNYKNEALRKFVNYKRKAPDAKYKCFLCVDTDVFEHSKRPPINKKSVKSELLNAGADSVTFINASHSIEDWFLADYEGVLNYLNLPKNQKRPNGKGLDVLQQLFKLAKKVYVKGHRTDGFIDKLNIPVIMSNCCQSISPLCKAMGFDCKTICASQNHNHL